MIPTKMVMSRLASKKPMPFRNTLKNSELSLWIYSHSGFIRIIGISRKNHLL